MEKETPVSIAKYSKYFERSAYRDALIDTPILANTFISIVIPAYRELGLHKVLKSIKACNKPKFPFELIILFNASEQDELGRGLNQQAKEELEDYLCEVSLDFPLHILEENQLPAKTAGVGLARKIGMDEAARRLLSIGREEGVILCLDADCQVRENYLTSVETYFTNSPQFEAGSLYFEHSLEEEEFEAEIYESIIYYELHLRYYKHAMRKMALPFDRYTVGSSMAVKVAAYLREGGMNKRKAGEDFYFLQKYLIKQKLGEINTTAVYPSPRISDRVPFGTGKAMLDHQEQKRDLKMSYSPKSFNLIGSWLKQIESAFPEFPKTPNEIYSYFGSDWEANWREMRDQSRDWESFQKRFYQWFTPFKLLKLIHFLRDEFYENETLTTSVRDFLGVAAEDAKAQLLALRKRDQF